MPEKPSVKARLMDALGLDSAPVAVSFCAAAPAGVNAPQARVAAGCSFWEVGAAAPLVTSAEHHQFCSIGIHTHTLADAPESQMEELGAALGAMQGLDYVRPEEVAALPVMSEPSKHVVYAPLGDVAVDPDVVLLFANGVQSLIITEAVARVDGGIPGAMGRPACALIPAVMNTGRSVSSLGCCGARAYLDTLSDGVALWGLVGARIADYAVEIEKLAHANSVLTQFHATRRQQIADGASPTVNETLATL
jgi:uncharacterized protein (DUF169 family)